MGRLAASEPGSSAHAFSREAPIDGGEASHLLLDTGLVRLGIFRAAPGHPRFHDSGPIAEHVFVFPRTSVVIRHAGKAPFVADPNIVTFYNRGQIYWREPVDPRGDLCEWFAPSVRLLAEVLALYDPAASERPDAPFRFSRAPSDARSYLRQRLVVRHTVDSSGGQPDCLLVGEVIARVLDHILAGAYAAHRGQGPSPSLHARHRELAEQLKATLALRYAQNLSLAVLAASVDCSPFHLCRVFRGVTGQTVHRYRHQLRLRRSLEELADARNDLAAVGLAMGFSSHSHFTESFRAAFGITPSAFRRSVTARSLRELAAASAS